jgi:hypothetical protein
MITAIKRSWTFFGCVFLLAGLVVLWYSIATDYDDSVAEGIYDFAQDAQSSTLRLRSDHVFEQERREHGRVEHATGTWRRIGEGGIAFSREFLTVSGQERGTDGTAIADMRKNLGVFVSLEFRQYQVLLYEGIYSSAPDSISGTYVADGNWGSARLIMKSDHTFEQDMTSRAVVRQVSGSVFKHEPAPADSQLADLQISDSEFKSRRLVSTRELSGIWGVPESTLRYWRCAEVGPPYVKLGGRIKYDLVDVELYVRANKRNPSVRAHGG